jgi:synaptobrevin homolog YKT6
MRRVSCTSVCCNVTSSVNMRACAGIGILKWNADNEATSLGMAVDVSNYGYFQRGPVKEMMAFVARTVAKRTHPGQRQSVQQVAHCRDRHLNDTVFYNE